MKRQLCSGLVLIFALVACARPEPLNLRARAIWRKHQRVVEAAVRGERTDVAELKDSVDFFEQTAGISLPGDHSPEIDWFPTRKTAQALEPLRHWYQANGDRLYWDRESGRVRVRPKPTKKQGRLG